MFNLKKRFLHFIYEILASASKINLRSKTGPLRSFVTAFFSLEPLQISDRRAFLPCCAERFRVGFSVFAWITNTNPHILIQISHFLKMCKTDIIFKLLCVDVCSAWTKKSYFYFLSNHFFFYYSRLMRQQRFCNPQKCIIHLEIH